MIYLANTFTPMMAPTAQFRGQPIPLAEAKALARDAASIVSHVATAQVLTRVLGRPVSFNRATVTLAPGDQVVCIIPKFRAEQAREFTPDELSATEFKAFLIEIEAHISHEPHE